MQHSALISALIVAACSSAIGCGGTDLVGAGEACTSDAECVDGLLCVATICQLPDPDVPDDIVESDVVSDATVGCDVLPDGAPCDDGNACTLNDACAGGVCTPGEPNPCESDNTCEVGTCDPENGCMFESLPDGDPCSINCFTTAQCLDGGCQVDPSSMVTCPSVEDETGCIKERRCDLATGECSVDVYKSPGEPCDTDSNLCSVEVCDDFGSCQDTEQINTCEDEKLLDPCQLYTCSTKTGECKSSGYVGEVSCDDGNPCTYNDKCGIDEFNFASCKGDPLPVDDNNPCTSDACIEGVVTHVKVDGIVCDPLDPCSPQGMCTEGVCVPSDTCACDTDQDCPQPANKCLGTAICDKTGGVPKCSYKEGTAVVCAPPTLPCHVTNCVPELGECVQQTVINDTPCDDGNACTAFDACSNGICQGGEIVDCDDGLYCNGSEFCSSETGCQLGQSPPVDDGIACTSDSCSESEGAVVHEPDDSACNDGVFCNGQEVCDPGVGCTLSSILPADDGIACTIDACTEDTQVITHQPDDGVCKSGNACFVELCDVEEGCQSTPIPDCCGNAILEEGEECDDGNLIDKDGCSLECVNECIWIAQQQVKAAYKVSATEGNFNASLGDEDLFGWAVASIGDLNGDGIEDMAVGHRLDDDGGDAQGAVWIVFLKADGQVKSTQKISAVAGNFPGELNVGDNFGSSVAAIGDLNGDGITELAVGALDDDDGGSARGAIWILFMKPDGTVASTQKISAIQGDFTGQLDNADHFGRSVAAIGDVDGDNVVDLAVGAYGDDDAGTDAGAVWVLFMKSDGRVKAELKLSGAKAPFSGKLGTKDLFGTSVAGLGDINGDGIPDLAIGAPLDDTEDFDQGAVWIVHLGENATVKNASKITGAAPAFGGLLSDTEYFGSSLALTADLDGNGMKDLIIGADGTDSTGSDKGAIWLVQFEEEGQLKAAQRVSVVEGGFQGELDDGDFFGASVAYLSGLDGKKPPRIAVGAWGDDDGGLDRGAVWLVDLVAKCTVCGDGVFDSGENCPQGNF